MRKRRRKKTLFNTQQRFGIRKFAIGAASVLIGLGLVGAKQVNTVLANAPKSNSLFISAAVDTEERKR